MTLQDSLQYFKGVGPRKIKLFKKLGISSIENILYYFPKRYEDRSNFSKLSKLTPGSIYTIRAKVLARSQRFSRRRKGFNITEAAFGDNTGKIYAVWFNQPYLKNYFKPGIEVILYGKVERYQDRLQMQSPEFEILESDENKAQATSGKAQVTSGNAQHTFGKAQPTSGKDTSLSLGKMVPVYRLSEGITQRYFRKIMKSVLDEFIPKVSDALPYDIRKKHNLLNLAKSLLYIHFPCDEYWQREAYRRLSFEEFFLYQIPILIRKIKRVKKKGIAHRIDGDIFDSFIKTLPFKLTMAQHRVIGQIKQDMKGSSPMQRLLQGEVASGKTVVAMASCAIALDGGYQVAFMVPTEILAKQHYENISCQISAISNRRGKIKVGLLASSISKKEKNEIYKGIKDGKIDLVVGTHSLLEENLKFKNLGLVIIDEQHKFGVGQRALLPRKGNNPDCLIMTATPIPRTLSLTFYGDLDISLLDQLPEGRLPVKTCLYSPIQRKEVHNLIEHKIKEGRQVYVVCPKIEKSDFLRLRSAQEVYSEIKHIFRQYKVSLVHGRLKQAQQDKIMSDFKNGLIDILVATTVLEVGIDVVNASVMVIEEAESFGLAQLHQLRGRIGRGNYQSYCLLIADLKGNQVDRRIKAIISLSDGFKIAEVDLKIRGPGEFFGRRQSGLSELRIANPLTQMHLLKNARYDAAELLRGDPDLCQRQNLNLKQAIKKRFPEYEELMMVA